MSRLPKPRRQRLSDITIGRKLVAIVVLCVGFGFMFMIGVQITGTRADLHELAYRNSVQVTGLLATSVAGGVRWQLPEVIERSYRSFAEDDAELASIAVLDIDGRILSTDTFHDHLLGHEFETAIEDAQETLSRNEVYTDRDSDHIVVIQPIVTGRDKTRVGTLAVTWSLSNLNASVSANLNRQGIVAGFSLLALIAILLSLLSVTVSHPLRAVCDATMRLSRGETLVNVPEVGRGDEIGELARALEIFKHHTETIDQLTREQWQDSLRLAEALENERKYNALHREFVAMASHEFRTPLAIIDGAAQRLIRRAERMTTDELLERVGKIRNAVTRMIGLIDSTLNASRMEAGRIELTAEHCDLRTILEAVCKRQQDIAPNHEITLDLGQAPKQLVADPKQLDQIFTNLMSNAVKYSPNNGRIEVTALNDGEMAAISFRDQGVGIPDSEVPKLFERFFRASTSTGIPGTGIGLNLAKQFVEMHGGSIDVASSEGDGSTFTVRLPLKPAAPGTDRPQPERETSA